MSGGGQELVYLYDGSFDGLLTAIFEAYARKERPFAITVEEYLQLGFGQRTVHIQPDGVKAERVAAGLESKLGAVPYEKIWTAFLADNPDKGTVIYRYVRHGLKLGRRVQYDLTHPDVLAIDGLWRIVGREAHLLKEFLRFSQMKSGVFYAKITPEHSILPLIMPHFADRYCVQPFLIHDRVHQMAGIYDLEGWYLVESSAMTIPEEAEDEWAFRRMWKQFYDTIAIRERANERCRRNHMPKKYWHNMTEHNHVETSRSMGIDSGPTMERMQGGGGAGEPGQALPESR